MHVALLAHLELCSLPTCKKNAGRHHGQGPSSSLRPATVLHSAAGQRTRLRQTETCPQFNQQQAKAQVCLCDRRPYYIRPPAKERGSARPRTCPEFNRLQATWQAPGDATSSPSRERGAAGDSSRQRRRRTTGAGSVWQIGRFRELPDAAGGTRSRSSNGAEARPWRRSHHHWPALWFVQMSAVVVSFVVAALVALMFALQEARMAMERARDLRCFLDGDDDGDDDGDAEGANGVSSVAATRRRQAPVSSCCGSL
ncbi:uncharacterized protein [Dermacentor andersoni]|uniref:uncharacterized protein n=1 Tax=Dermacentor andersoni TaxID=34620 RepID=UPI003B3A766F